MCTIDYLRWFVRAKLVLSWYFHRIYEKQTILWFNDHIVSTQPLVLNLKYQQCVLATGMAFGFFFFPLGKGIHVSSIVLSLPLLLTITSHPTDAIHGTGRQNNKRISRKKPCLNWSTCRATRVWGMRWQWWRESGDNDGESRWRYDGESREPAMTMMERVNDKSLGKATTDWESVVGMAVVKCLFVQYFLINMLFSSPKITSRVLTTGKSRDR